MALWSQRHPSMFTTRVGITINFAQLTQRDGSFLVGREKDDNFTFDKLKGNN